MAIGTTAALIGLAAAQAAPGVVKGITGSRAAKNVAKEGEKVYNQVYRDQQMLQSPYARAGGQSMNMLGALMTPPGMPGAYNPMGNYQVRLPGDPMSAVPRPLPAMGVGAGNQVNRRRIMEDATRLPFRQRQLGDLMGGY